MPEATGLAKQVQRLLQEKVKTQTLIDFVAANDALHAQWIKAFLERTGGADVFGLSASRKALASAVKEASAPKVQSQAGALFEGFDSQLTQLDLQQGNLADICQNLRWQVDLFSAKKLSKLASAQELVVRSSKFDQAFAARKVSAGDYPGLMKDSLPALTEAAELLKNKALAEQVGAIEKALVDAKALQHRHWEYLTALAALLGL